MLRQASEPGSSVGSMRFCTKKDKGRVRTGCVIDPVKCRTVNNSVYETDARIHRRRNAKSPASADNAQKPLAEKAA